MDLNPSNRRSGSLGPRKGRNIPHPGPDASADVARSVAEIKSRRGRFAIALEFLS